MADVRIGLLGPLQVRVAGREVAVAGGRLRELLQQLAVAAPRPVSSAQLAQALWLDDAPADIANALQSLVSRLRRVLADPALIKQSPAGYALAIAAEDVDVNEFARLARAAHAQGNADPRAGAALAREALALWRGEPPAELVAPLSELYLQLRADLIEARLQSGEADEVLAELEELVSEYPLRERFIELRLRALAAAGRPAEAVAAYEQLRTTLADDLGVDPSAALQQLHVSLLRGELDAAPPARRDTLPASFTTFIGRDEDVAHIGELLQTSRLITLVGPGGGGKTRLAIEAGRSLHRTGVAAEGIWLVELAPVVDSADVPQAIYDALGVREATLLERGGRPIHDTIERIVETLRERSVVLIVDNCEHVLEAAAHVTTTLLTHCPQLRIITTSREPLGVLGESLVAVRPLEHPSAGADDPATYPAMRLFADRAVAVAPDFALTADTLGPVAEIVRRLDGLPLAIELAAARMRTMPVEQIAERLSDRFRLLAGGNRAAVARHRTLRAVVQWSWELLSAEERTLVERLAVFSGSISADAAAVMVGPADVDALLASLVDKSLLQLLPGHGTVRYRMLETIREFGLDQLADQGEVASARQTHADYFAAHVRQAEPRLRTGEQLDWIARLETDQADILGALKFLADSGQAQRAIQMSVDLAWYWMILGRHGEVATWCRIALDADGERRDDTALLAESFYAINVVAGSANDSDPLVEQHVQDLNDLSKRLEQVRATDLPMLVMLRPIVALFSGRDRLDEDAFADALASPDPWIAAAIRSFRAAVAENDGDVTGMRADATIALDQLRELGDRWGQANSLQVLGQLDVMEGDLAAAESDYREALRLAAELGADEDQLFMRLRLIDVLLRSDQREAARREMEAVDALSADSGVGAAFESMFVQILQAELAMLDGRMEDARRLQALCLARVKALPALLPTRGHGVALCLAMAARFDLIDANPDGAYAHLLEGYRIARATRDMPVVATVGVVVAQLAWADGAAAEAAELLGASAQLRGSDDWTNLHIRALTGELRAVLPDFDERYASGRALPRSEAMAALDPARLDRDQARRL